MIGFVNLIRMVLLIVFIANTTRVIILAKKYLQDRKTKREESIPYSAPFSVSEYLSRMERVHLDIARKKEQKKLNVIILWLGLDGLKINENGSYEWIRRGERNKSDIEFTSDLQKALYMQALLQNRRSLLALQCAQSSAYLPYANLYSQINAGFDNISQNIYSQINANCENISQNIKQSVT